MHPATALLLLPQPRSQSEQITAGPQQAHINKSKTRIQQTYLQGASLSLSPLPFNRFQMKSTNTLERKTLQHPTVKQLNPPFEVLLQQRTFKQLNPLFEVSDFNQRNTCRTHPFQDVGPTARIQINISTCKIRRARGDSIKSNARLAIQLLFRRQRAQHVDFTFEIYGYI
jgi:hypothetical protein